MAHLCAVLPQLKSARLISCRLAALVLFTLLPLSLPAQAPASLRGTVRDAQGSPVAGATLQLQAKDSTQTQTVHTDSQGTYSFPALSAGLYALRAVKDGYDDAEIPTLFFGPKESANESKRVDLTLSPKKAPATQPASAAKPEFFDQPQFTVAGVTDTTNLGGHGSDTIVRTREALAKETVSLGKALPGAGSAVASETEKSLRESVEREPGKAELHHLLANVEENLGNSLEAVREYQRAAELDPSEAYLFDWGSELLLHHAPEPAQEVFTKGNRLYPHSVRTLIGLGAAWFARGSYEQAVQRICEASDLDPADPVPYLFLGTMQTAEPAPSAETVEKLHRFVALQPDNAQANYYYAVGLWKLRKDPEDAASAAQAEAWLRKVIHLDPRFAAAHLQLGILHIEQKNYPRAISEFQQAIQSDPQMEKAHYRLAQAYRQIGDMAKSEAELQIYNQLAKESAQKVERERHEIPQFVYTLRDQPPDQKQ